MELTVEKFKQFAIALTRILKDLETENLALRIVIRSTQETFKLEGDPEELVRIAKNGPAVKKLMDAKYDAPLAQALSRADKEEGLMAAFFESLRNWKPSDPQN